MAPLQYDEGGNLAVYFIITFLALVLVPLTLSASPSKKRVLPACDCQPCKNRRKENAKRERPSIFNPKLGAKGLFIVLGWSIFGFLSYKAATTKFESKTYNPFEILNLAPGSTPRQIKSRFYELSKTFHPDKVKPTVNETVEFISNRFVDLTKAYKSLTDPAIRENLEKYGNPDGRQETTMGLAIPKWIIEDKNNIWVLGVYGLVFGGLLPFLIGRWWFGWRALTKDGIHPKSAAAFFKTLTEDSVMDDVFATFGKAFEWDAVNVTKTAATTPEAELETLEQELVSRIGDRWRVTGIASKESSPSKWKALVLLYAHLLRVPIQTASLKKDQATILLQTPTLLSALLNISISRNWLAPTLAVMRLHAHLAQALFPSSTAVLTGITTKPTPSSEASSTDLVVNSTPKSKSKQQRPGLLPVKHARWSQFPSITLEEAKSIAPTAESLEDFVHALETKQDTRLDDIHKAAERWGRLDVVDAAFKVIGERSITPSAIVYLVLKLRISPLSAGSSRSEPVELDVDATKAKVKADAELDEAFLASKLDAEDVTDAAKAQSAAGWAHAPYWPSNRKPTWWVVLADDKSNRVVVPPMRLADIPYASSTDHNERDYRSYKLQFQAPSGSGIFTWKVYFVSDTFIGEEIVRDMVLKIEDVSSDDRDGEDEISEPDEDSLAGQMASMRGGPVKRHANSDDEEEEDSESDTDGDESSEDSSSDSDSD